MCMRTARHMHASPSDPSAFLSMLYLAVNTWCFHSVFYHVQDCSKSDFASARSPRTTDNWFADCRISVIDWQGEDANKASEVQRRVWRFITLPVHLWCHPWYSIDLLGAAMSLSSVLICSKSCDRSEWDLVPSAYITRPRVRAFLRVKDFKGLNHTGEEARVLVPTTDWFLDLYKGSLQSPLCLWPRGGACRTARQQQTRLSVQLIKPTWLSSGKKVWRFLKCFNSIKQIIGEWFSVSSFYKQVNTANICWLPSTKLMEYWREHFHKTATYV